MPDTGVWIRQGLTAFGEDKAVTALGPFGFQQLVAVFTAEMRDVDFGHWIGGQHRQPVASVQPGKRLAGS